MPHTLGPIRADPFLPVVGETTAKIIETLRVFVNQGETVLISGPTGAGKSRLARWCHCQSPRRHERFETLELLSIPQELQMAELTGWKRGAFTGATQSVAGALTRAAGGTLFIDEIDKLSLEAQAGLLRILEDRRYRVLGDDNKEYVADVQFIVGTNIDLYAAVVAGQFREDLYYRINVFPVRLPPLADRSDEIPGWAAFMLERCAGPNVALTLEALELLRRHPWPGNLRQLDNVIRRSFAFACIGASGPDDELTIETQHIERALAFEGATAVTPENLSSQLWNAAQSLARMLVSRELSEVLPLERLDGFRGMVLGAAVQLLDSREAAFRLLGREHLLKGRNHHRALKLELDKTRLLLEALGDPRLDPSLNELIRLGSLPGSGGRGEARAFGVASR